MGSSPSATSSLGRSAASSKPPTATHRRAAPPSARSPISEFAAPSSMAPGGSSRSRRLHARWKKVHRGDRSRRRLRRHVRGRPVRPPAVDVESIPQTDHLPTDAAVDAKRLRETVLKAIQSLPELERTSMLLYFYEGLDLTRIAKRFGISKGYSCRIHWRAIRLLATALAGVPEAFGVEVGQ